MTRRRKQGCSRSTALQVAKVSVLSAAGLSHALQTPRWSSRSSYSSSSVPDSPHHRSTSSSSSRTCIPFGPSSRYIPKSAKRMASICRHLSSSTVTADPVELDSLTVKELRQRIKDWGLESKGLSGKRKAELIEYMVEAVNGKSSEAADGAVVAEESSVVQNNDDVVQEASKAKPATTTTRQGIRMPPMPPTAVNGEEQAINDSVSDMATMNDADACEMSPLKAKTFRDVLESYPPLCNYINPETLEPLDPLGHTKPEGLGDHDIRHTYHPMLKEMRYSDLDVVFVGTASCTPGTTRGVSCTALRLQWRRKRGHILGTNKGNDKNKKEKKEDTNDSSNVENLLSPDGRYDESGDGDFSGGGEASGRTWLFDCGESTQLQIQRTGSIKPGKISKIFITHAHGDHSFGLPGLLCLMGTNRDRDSPPIDIYGPEGLRVWLRVAIRYSVSRIVPPYRVHELLDIPYAPEWEETRRNPGRFFLQLEKFGKGGRWVGKGLAGDDPTSWISRAPMMNLEPSSQFGEIPGGRDIFPIYDHPLSADGAPVWEVEDEGDVRVFAAPMSHGVPCVGYVVEEEGKPGRLRPDLVEPIVKRNYAALREAGMKAPMKVMAVIKDLPEGGSFTFPDGTEVKQSDVVEPTRRGRKVAICGDTADARAMEGIAKDPDLLIHEATNTFLSGVDKDTNKNTVTKDAIIHGHSTPEMAGNFAKRIGAKRLVLNHFSPRYKGDQSIDSISLMTRIERQAMKASNLPIDSVAAAWDLMILPIPQTEG